MADADEQDNIQEGEEEMEEKGDTSEEGEEGVEGEGEGKEDEGKEDEGEEGEEGEEEEPYSPLREQEQEEAPKEGEEEEDIADEDQKIIDRAVQKATQPIVIAGEVDQYLKDKPELGEYRDKIIDTAKKIPQLKVEAVARTVVPESVYIKMGASMEREANDEAKKAVTGGSSKRATSSGAIPDVSTMHKNEFEALAESVKQGRFKG